MLKPDRILRLFTEMVFVLLGGLVIWLGLGHRFFVDRHSRGWLVISIVVIVWGLLGFRKSTGRPDSSSGMIRGVVLVLLGVVLLAISRVPFEWVGPLLALAGFLLIVRGLAGAFLVVRAS